MPRHLVCLSVELDADAEPAAMEHLLELLRDADVVATFDLPRAVSERHPAFAERIGRDGHEITTPDERGAATHRRSDGVKPLDYWPRRDPASDLTVIPVACRLDPASRGRVRATFAEWADEFAFMRASVNFGVLGCVIEARALSGAAMLALRDFLATAREAGAVFVTCAQAAREARERTQSMM